MKWIIKYESFTNDDNRGEDTSFPELNPVTKMSAKEYVDSKMKTEDKFELFKVVGIEPKKDLSPEELEEMFDDVREKAIEYYTKNPEEMGKPIQHKKFNVNGGDGIPRTNNIGGTSHANSRVVGENKLNFDSELEISEDDMYRFNNEEPLKRLISYQKILLSNKKIHYNSNDADTKRVLDIYFDMDGINENNSTFVKFKHKINNGIEIVVKKDKSGIIEHIDNKSNIRFPFRIGQKLNRNIEVWACNNNFYMNGKDTCPEEKIFGIKKSDIPAGHELRRLFPSKFR